METNVQASVYSRKLLNKETELGFQNINNHCLEERIKKLPQELRIKFSSFGGRSKINSENYVQVREALIKLAETEYENSYFYDIRDILILIESMKFPLCDNPYHSSDEDEHHNDNCKENLPDEHANERYNLKHLILLFIILFGIFVSYWYSFNNKEGLMISSEPNKIKEWEKNIINLKEKFPSQNENTWLTIRSGIKTTVVEKPVQPSVLLLVHNDKKTSMCIAQTVGKEAAKLLSDSPQEPIVVRGEELKTNNSLMTDYGLFAEIYKHDIKKKHVMIILDLQEIPAVLAQTFHILCDVENPLVRDAAFLFTMQINEFENQKPTAIAEKHLKLLWKDSLEVDIMDPLITRVTNMVLPLKFENELPC